MTVRNDKTPNISINELLVQYKNLSHMQDAT